MRAMIAALFSCTGDEAGLLNGLASEYHLPELGGGSGAVTVNIARAPGPCRTTTRYSPGPTGDAHLAAHLTPAGATTTDATSSRSASKRSTETFTVDVVVP